ncbi:MAG: D-arabitol-phosphate dehydrogenase [Chloroflexi bacterium ADurb.Bin180]|nr:MAG: D-arabitol-phosphate dehydrogenase [Chloroflexi bacterium ADurb.Bin180]
MKEALLYGVRDLRVVESPKPEIGPYDVLVRVRACGICPTDLRKYLLLHESAQVPHLPLNMGHEFAGDVVEVGAKVTRPIKVGMRVAASDYGGYAEYARLGPCRTEEDIAIEAIDTVFELPENVSYEEGTLMEPLACAIHAVRDQAKIQVGQTVAILGSGQMGLLKMGVAQAMGARVIMVDLREDRLAWAVKLGADETVNASTEDPVAAVRRLTHGEGAEAVIVSPGRVPEMIPQALGMAAYLGRVVLFGGYKKGTSVPFDPNVIHYGEIILTGCEGIGVKPSPTDLLTFKIALDLIASGRVPVSKIITHTFPLDEITVAFGVLERMEAMKVVLKI